MKKDEESPKSEICWQTKLGNSDYIVDLAERLWRINIGKESVD